MSSSAQADADANLKPRSVVEYGYRRTIVTLAVILATLLEIVDTTIVNVALPTIQGNLGANIEEGSLIVTGYIVANVVVIPLTPWLSERFGRRAYFFASILIFTIASMMCGIANSLPTLLFWRIIQGAGGGGLISTSQAILRETYPPEKQGAAQGIFALGAIVGPTIGPTIGGIITDNLNWRWVFYINVPLGILAMILVWIYLRNPIDPHKKSVDSIGVVLLAVGIGCLQYVLDQGQEKDWFSSSVIVWSSIISVITIAGFLIWELYGTKTPIVNLRVLRYRSVSAGSSLGFVLGITLTATLVILPEFVQGVLGFTATLSGELIFMRAITVMLFTPVSVTLATNPNVDLRYLIAMGFTLVGVSSLMMAQVTTTSSGFFDFALASMVGGAGLSFTFIPLSLAVFAGVGQRDIPGASSFFNLARQLGGSVGTALLVTVITRSIASHQYDVAQSVIRSRPVISRFVAGEPNLPKARADLYQIAEAQATTLSYADASRATGVVTLCLTPLVLLIRRRAKDTPVAIEAH